MAGFGGSVGAGGTGKAAIEGIGAGGSEDHPPFLEQFEPRSQADPNVRLEKVGVRARSDRR